MMNKPPTMMNQYQNQSLKHHQQLMNQSLIHQQQSMNQIDQQVFDFNNLPFPHPPLVSRSINRPIDHPQFVQMNRSYGMWAPPPQQQYRNPNRNPAAMKPPSSAFNKSLGPRRSNWKKGKRFNNDKNLNFINYDPQTSIKLQHWNRPKTRKFVPKRKLNKNTIGPVPSAPRNTSSYIIRAKKSGGIAPLVSSPAFSATPTISPFREEEWGLDAYGSMDGFIRFRSPLYDMEVVTNENGDEEDEGGSVKNDVEDPSEVERRLMDDLDRIEIIYNPNGFHDDDDDPDTDAAAADDDGEIVQHGVLEDRINDQETNYVQLEEENMILKEKLVLMEKELGELRKRMLLLETSGNRGDDDIVNNVSENESDHTSEDLDEEYIEGDNCQLLEEKVELLVDEKVDNNPC